MGTSCCEEAPGSFKKKQWELHEPNSFYRDKVAFGLIHNLFIQSLNCVLLSSYS